MMRVKPKGNLSQIRKYYKVSAFGKFVDSGQFKKKKLIFLGENLSKVRRRDRGNGEKSEFELYCCITYGFLDRPPSKPEAECSPVARIMLVGNYFFQSFSIRLQVCKNVAFNYATISIGTYLYIFVQNFSLSLPYIKYVFLKEFFELIR